MNKLLYLLLLVATFFMGMYDDGNVTAFVILLLFGICKATEIILHKLHK